MHSCRVRLPRNDRLYHAHCATLRNQQTNMQRQYFKLTTPIEVDAVNADHTPIFPRLDQNLDVISAKAMFGDQDAKWFSNYYGMIRAFNDTAKTLMGMMKTNPMKDYKDYKTVYHAFLDTVKVYLTNFSISFESSPKNLLLKFLFDGETFLKNALLC